MTLLECCIAIAIIAFVSLLGAHFFGIQSQSLLRFELEKLYSAVVYAQRKAIATGIEQVIKLDLKNQSYVIDEAHYTLHSGVTYGYAPESWGPPAHPVYQIDKSVTFKDDTIICYADGTLNAGTLYLKDKRSKYFYALTSGITPTVYLRMYRYQNKIKKWHLLEQKL